MQINEKTKINNQKKRISLNFPFINMNLIKETESTSKQRVSMQHFSPLILFVCLLFCNLAQFYINPKSISNDF